MKNFIVVRCCYNKCAFVGTCIHLVQGSALLEDLHLLSSCG
uniref:Uncharacterized protein n=1 Tax=Ascaris lumbricoides TaxID=6252 RepID=A0A0M3I0T2_ASCLU